MSSLAATSWPCTTAFMLASSITHFTELGDKRRNSKSTLPPGFPNKLADAASGGRISRREGNTGSAQHRDRLSSERANTSGESWYEVMQPPRVRGLSRGQGGSRPPERVAGGGSGDAMRSAAAVHPAGPHASARIAWRALTIVASASAPAPRRMISLRAWL